jgi:hypothetical protein
VPHSGYKVIFVPFSQGRPSGAPLDVLTGFLGSNGHALAGPWGWCWTNRGRFSSPTMSATLSGGSRPHLVIVPKGDFLSLSIMAWIFFIKNLSVYSDKAM